MSKLSYSKPTVTKVGTLTEKTEGGFKREVMEVLSYRASTQGGS